MTRRLYIIILVTIFLFTSLRAQEHYFEPPEKGFTSWLPADTWENALISGNGTMGAMVMGNPHNETIILNHAQLYLPVSKPMPPIDQASRLEEIRQLMLEGKYEEAAAIPVEQSMKEGYGGKLWSDPFIPAYDIKVQMEPSNVEKYTRMVDFETGETKVVWKDGKGTFERKLFVSRRDSTIVMSISGTNPFTGKLAFESRPVPWDQWDYINKNIRDTEMKVEDEEWLVYRSAFNNHSENIIEGYEGVGKIVVKGGHLDVKEGWVSFENANEVLLIVKIEPNFSYDKSKVDKIKMCLNKLMPDYNTLLDRHKAIHSTIFNRVSFDLDDHNDKTLDSEPMVLKAKGGNITTSMIERQFDAARYNILSATGTNPPNLQGMWGGTWTPPWSSDFTHDGNVEVAVSSLLSGNKAELMHAYFNYHEDRLQYYRDNAKNLYDCQGIHIPSHTSSHGWDNHFGKKWCLTFWHGGAGWTAKFFYDYWLYTGDLQFLKERAYPFMKEALLFYEDFMIEEDDGKYMFVPSYSPENTPSSTNSQATINATMDVMITKELLRNCIAAAKVLGTDYDKVSQWKKMLSELPEYAINDDGALREWLWDGLEDNYDHRHISHLYALYDMVAPEFKQDQALRDAAHTVVEKHMEKRRDQVGGEMVFGLAQLGFVAANLEDAELTEEIINMMSGPYWTSGMATLHNPGSLFNMDLSGGYPSVIIRSLVYDEPGMIKLLPAAPKSWKKGAIGGVLLRKQITLNNLSWEPDEINVSLTSAIDQKVVVQCPENIEDIITDDDIDIKQLPDHPDKFELNLPSGKKVDFSLKF